MAHEFGHVVPMNPNSETEGHIDLQNYDFQPFATDSLGGSLDDASQFAIGDDELPGIKLKESINHRLAGYSTIGPLKEDSSI